MLSRYQTGPAITLAVLLGAAAWCAVGLREAIRFHHPQGWFLAAGAVFFLLAFDRRYRRGTD